MLWDSNIIIYSSLPEHAFLQQLSEDQPVYVSAISYLEVLGYHNLAESDQVYFERFFRAATIFDISHTILEAAVTLRQQRKMSLGDALIAATSLKHQLTLLSRNKGDFSHIASLKITDPFEEREE
ncbi:type II toxin-antitoxin system VapC family toxin [Tunicatimonas pelagia]|uniref:type II toxin-antitoxin system VapC family toxin n=1 Tax=Tunicatimonas pelagia TaxID=931531 RepID=UPI0026671560|nr:type II toxin-antitoxin system VapC family toxin [Tunicatimonas pelagia]WKN44266.1 type II toxin-antitoxin system VapC family toxin [Tunicatimonas pelagia]